ncbi:outer membrane protein assembly factor BamE [Phaeobacter sp. HF9A]|uniref:outer membrane protein assembly factor BamE n=1 Tax=Phaeobacter sp. HF9A TaxID=2721561 RepID=UPI0014304CDD|nr:outer membrane protein assembly factor BamE [Phaeobacter sp. HF9A]NIZ14398.1 outer membrane protein assembly factor BamE [Phaeobacter sp. HF9A]
MFAKAKTVKTSLRAAFLVGILTSLVACTAQYRKHGWVPGPDLLREVVVGVDTRDSVAETVGEPTIDSLADDSGYYYVTSRMKYYGSKAPKVVSRDLVAVTFDSRGVVDSVQRYTLADGRAIPLERRVTDSSIQDKTFLRQLVGNLGNINPGSFLQQ